MSFNRFDLVVLKEEVFSGPDVAGVVLSSFRGEKGTELCSVEFASGHGNESVYRMVSQEDIRKIELPKNCDAISEQDIAKTGWLTVDGTLKLRRIATELKYAETTVIFRRMRSSEKVVAMFPQSQASGMCRAYSLEDGFFTTHYALALESSTIVSQQAAVVRMTEIALTKYGYRLKLAQSPWTYTTMVDEAHARRLHATA